MKITVVGWLLIGAAVLFTILALRKLCQTDSPAGRQEPQKPNLPYPGGVEL